MSCNGVRICYIPVVRRIPPSGIGSLYVCNCNGIREREVRAAIDQGATRPAEVFRRCGAAPQCAKCVCDMRDMIAETREALRYAAE